jgi:hypothetical protein
MTPKCNNLRNATAAFVCLMLAALTLCSGATAEIIAKTRSGAAPPMIAPKFGKLTLSANLPHEKIAQFLNQFEFKFDSAGEAAGALKYDGTLIIGRIKIEHSDNVAFPLRISAPFTLKGALGGFDIDQAGDAVIDISLEFDTDWCPAVRFNEPSVVLKNKERLPETVTKSIPSLGDFIASKFLGRELRKNLDCDTIRSNLAKAWGTYALPVQLGSKPLFLSIDPRTVALSAIAVTESHISFTMALAGAIGVQANRSKFQSKPLPKLQLIEPVSAKDPADLEVVVSAPMNLNF